MRDVGFPGILTARRSHREAQAVSRREDHCDAEGARGRSLGALAGASTRRRREHDLPMEVEVRRHGSLRREAATSARAREREAEAAARRSRARQRGAEGAGVGKMVTASQRRRAVNHLKSRELGASGERVGWWD